MKNKFKNAYGEWALITGASSGIGKALAWEIAGKGLNLVLVARRQAELEKLEKDLKKQYSVSIIVCHADLSKQAGIDNVISRTEKLGIGLLVLSAGMENNGLFVKNDLNAELQVIQLNVISTLKLTHHFTREMEKRKKGGVLFVSSLIAHMPSPYFSNYAATKAYVLNLGISLYGELKSNGIDVSVLSPGVTDTPMSANTRVDWSKTKIRTMTAEEVARETIQYFGKKLSIIPGKGNKTIEFMAKKVFPYTRLAMANQKMMQKALDPSRL